MRLPGTCGSRDLGEAASAADLTTITAADLRSAYDELGAR